MKKKKIETTTALAAFDIIRCASGWLRRHLPDRFGTAEPALDQDGQRWRAPVILAYPGIVPGQVGELVIDAGTGEVITHTDIEQMKTQALELWELNHARIKAAVLGSADERKPNPQHLLIQFFLFPSNPAVDRGWREIEVIGVGDWVLDMVKIVPDDFAKALEN